jgi:hypothetical protein
VQEQQYPALDDPASSINHQLGKTSITYHYSINWYHPASILSVQPLIIESLVGLLD